MKGRTKVAMVLISAVLTVLATSSGAPADSAATCLGERATIVGTEGDDLIAGTSKDDVIVALAGNDVINAHGGDDLVCAGDGNDRIDAGDGFFDGIDGGAGDDWIDGGDAALTIAIYKDSPGPVVVDLSARTASGDGTDTLANVNSVVGSDFDDVLTGDGRMNLIAGEDGNDTIRSGGGSDMVSGDAGDDVVDAARGATWPSITTRPMASWSTSAPARPSAGAPTGSLTSKTSTARSTPTACSAPSA
jgi:Ca2+-binding RTX toxin-like protein